MKNISTKKISFVGFFLMIASAVTGAIFTSEVPGNKGSLRNGRLFYEESFYGDITCIAVDSTDIMTCHDTVSGAWDDPSWTSLFPEDTSYDYCGWCGDNTTGNDEISGLDPWCY